MNERADIGDDSRAARRIKAGDRENYRLVAALGRGTHFSAQHHQTPLESFDPRCLSIAIDGKAFSFQITRLIVHASRKLWIQTAVVFHYAPVRRDSFASVGAIFLGSLSSDPKKDAGCQWASYIRGKILRQSAPQFADRDQFAFANIADQLVNKPRR